MRAEEAFMAHPPSQFDYDLHFLLTLCSFEQLQLLGKRVSNAGDEVKDRLRCLSLERASLRELWEKRCKILKQCHELQLFLRDSEQIDAATGAQEVFLCNIDLGVSCILHFQQHTWMFNSY